MTEIKAGLSVNDTPNRIKGTCHSSKADDVADAATVVNLKYYFQAKKEAMLHELLDVLALTV